MTLLNAGYWQTAYWPSRYWQADYWPEYGAVTVVGGGVSGKPMLPRTVKRKTMLPLPRDMLESLKIYLELKLGETHE